MKRSKGCGGETRVVQRRFPVEFAAGRHLVLFRLVQFDWIFYCWFALVCFEYTHIVIWYPPLFRRLTAVMFCPILSPPSTRSTVPLSVLRLLLPQGVHIVASPKPTRKEKKSRGARPVFHRLTHYACAPNTQKKTFINPAGVWQLTAPP